LKNPASLSREISLQAQIAGFEFKKRRQLSIGVQNETLAVAAMRVGNPRL
jgi:hypothetical protein